MKKLITELSNKVTTYMRMLIVQCVSFLINKLSEFELILNRYFNNPNPFGYEDLTPICKGDEDKKYSVALEWALKNENIKNVALTGAYGSGKSSIIQTFEKEHRGYHYLNISLASFSDNFTGQDNDDSKNGKEVNIDRLIELSILQQMFYHVRHHSIPDSRFKRIKSIRGKNLLIKTLFSIIWLISLLLFINPRFIQNTAIWKEIDLSNPFVSYLLPSIIILGIGLMIAKSIRIANNSKLNKLNVQSGEIEISQDIDSSILNKHLDEILYFFEVTKFNVVILEDLDRFNNPDIFTKLRELNILINSSKQIHRRVVFIYAIKDDMFHDKNRTKFFDFIIPVIPVVNTSNSGAMLHSLLIKDNSSETKSISPDLIDDVSMYIDDMRLLKNICNEYIIYKEKLSSKLHLDNLLAMIIYKNIFPSDFVDLHNGKGKVFTIFESKPALIKERIDDINTEIKSIKKRIEDIENVCLKNIQELRAIYIYTVIEKLSGIYSFYIGDKEYNFSEIKEDNPFNILLKTNKIGYYEYQYNSYYGRQNKVELKSNFSFNDIEKEIDTSKTYQERERFIQDKKDNKIEQFKKRIEELKIAKNEVKSWTLQQIAEKIGLIDSFDAIKNEKLIVYLIRNGYINENYHDYISYFHEGLITKEDREFRFSVLNHEALPFDYKLTKVDNLVKKMRLNEFESKEALNCSLLDFLLTKQEEYKDKYTALIKQICSKNKSAIAFIDCFIDKGLNIDIFINSLCQNWNTFMDYIIQESGYSSEKKDEYLKLIIENIDIETIEILNKNKSISKYLTQKQDFLSVFTDELPIKTVIKALNIKFENLEQSESENKLLDFIYENDYYAINKDMIALFIKAKSAPNTVHKLNTANYTTIKNSECQPLIDYIDNNIEEYISNVFLTIPENTQESEEAIVKLLNIEDEELSLEKRKKIIEKQTVLISHLEHFDEMEHNLLEFIVENSKMAATWENVICYYELKEEIIDDILISFLNQEINYRELSKTKLNANSKKSEEFIKKISSSLILCLEISDRSFEFLMKSIPYSYNKLAFENLSDNKVNWMIISRFLNLTVDNYNLLKEHFSEKHIDLLKQYSHEFIENQAEYSLDGNDVLALINSSTFNQQQKVSIIQNTDNELIIGNKELSCSICDILVESHKIELDFDLLKSLIQYSRKLDNKLKLLIRYFDSLNNNQITALLNLFEEPYSSIASKGKHPSISKNQLNLELVEKLDRKGYISSFSIKEKEGKIKVNTKLV
ncbi:YobI family P-loop NTPase [Viscerimonas tarda]